MRVPRAVAKFNRRITNPLAVRFGGWAPLNGTLEHVGRKSGKTYQTPLNIFETADGLLSHRIRPRIALGAKRFGRWSADGPQGGTNDSRRRCAHRQQGGCRAARDPWADDVPTASLQRSGVGTHRTLAGLGDREHLGTRQPGEHVGRDQQLGAPDSAADDDPLLIGDVAVDENRPFVG